MPLIEARLLERVFSSRNASNWLKASSTRSSASRAKSFRSETEVLIAEVPVGNWYEHGAPITPERVGAQ